jgi:hypothetical protein
MLTVSVQGQLIEVNTTEYYLTQVDMNRGYTTDHENVIQLRYAARPKVASNWCHEPEPKSDPDV